MQINLGNPDELTLENVREFIRAGDDSTHTQIRVTEDGIAYLSKTVGSEGVEGLQFYLETYDPGNGYVGEEAANDDEWVKEVFDTLRNSWRNGARGYIDH